MVQEWEDGDLFEDDDSSESTPTIPGPSPLPLSTSQTPQSLQTPQNRQKAPRRIRVKPMSAGMRLKWPEVATCLLTLDNGRQIMFVR